MPRINNLNLLVLIFALAASPALGQLAFDSGSDGSDGDLIIADDETFVLDMNDHADGVFNFISVDLGLNAILNVAPNDDNTPLVILVQQDFIMGNGADIILSGGNGGDIAENMGGSAGPGGFPGGVGGIDGPVPAAAGPGLGPGGGIAGVEDLPEAGGGTNGFMRPSLIPLIGGSGGGGGWATAAGNSLGGGGGGGGGALLIAVSGVFDMSVSSSTQIIADGGDGGGVFVNGSGARGSGGAVRIMASEIRGGWFISCKGGSFPTGLAGEQGIVRIETFRLTRAFGSIAARSFQSLPGLIDSSGTDLSTLRISRIGSVVVALDAGANLALPDVIIPAGDSNPIAIEVTATNVTPGQTATIRINYEGNGGRILEGTTTALAGTNALSTATASMDLDAGVGTMAAVLRTAPFSMAIELAGSAVPQVLDGMKVTLDGELVTTIERVSIAGQPSREVVYVTASGKRRSLPHP